jgi:hypothetical protein
MDIPFHIAADGNPALGNAYIPGIALYGHFIAGIYPDAFKAFSPDVDYFFFFRQLHPIPVHHHRAIPNYNVPAGHDVIIAYDNAASHPFAPLFCFPGIYAPCVRSIPARYPL